MPEGPGRKEDHKRATWVAVRTLRQRPKVVGQGANGEPIYEVRSVRLILRDRADHFNRLAECSNCGREVPGAPVRSQSDLTRPPHSVSCTECMRSATGSSSASDPMPGENAKPPEPEPAEAMSQPTSEPVASAVDDGRIAALESQLGVVLTLLTDLADVQRTESVQRREADDALQSQFRAALLQGLDDVRPDGAPSTNGEPSSVDALEARVRQSFAGVVELVQSQRRELATLGAALAETRSELGAVAEANRTVGARLDDVASRLSALPPPGAMVEAFRDEIAQAMAAVVNKIQQLAEVHDTLRGKFDGLLESAFDTEARLNALASAAAAGAARMDAFEQRTAESVDRLTRLIELERRIPEAERPSPDLEAEEKRLRTATAPASAASGNLLDVLDRQLQEAELRLARRVSTHDPS